MGVVIGFGYFYEIIFEKEVYFDFYGECGCFMGGIYGMFFVQYEVFCECGYFFSEVFNEIVEEVIQFFYFFIGVYGMDWMFDVCFIIVCCGVIDWIFKFKDVFKFVFNNFYDLVKDGFEIKCFFEYNFQFDYCEKYEKEFEEICNFEIWCVGKVVCVFCFENIK